MSARDNLIEWQRRMSEQPCVWTVYIPHDGGYEPTGNLYDSREAAEVEAEWRRERGDKRAKAEPIGHVHTLQLSKERWLK